MKQDPLGQACLSSLKGIKGLEIIVHSDHSEDDIIPVDYLFRSYNEMPLLEQVALKMCKGKILDVGAGAGCHSKWLLNNGFDITAIEYSPGAIEAIRQQSIPNKQVNFFQMEESNKYDTLLILMNGTGIAGTMDNFPSFLEKCKQMLQPQGQILIDSSDIIYLYEEEDGSYLLPMDKYYGEVTYQMEFGDHKSEWFNWLYLNFDLFKEIANENGFLCELMIEGEHYNYLARLTLN